MKVLLTNDDGYKAKGILAMADALIARGHVVAIVAPESQRSAVSHAVTLHKPLRLKRATHMERENLSVYYSSGTPSDCSMLGLMEVAPDSDILISGINSGPNLGEDVIYSGTVAAAMEGSLIGYRSIAVSLSDYDGNDYSLAAEFAAGLAEQVASSDSLPKHALINVNAPAAPVSEYKGFRVASLGSRKYTDVLEKRVDPRGQQYFWVAGQMVRNAEQPGTDVHAVFHGYVSVTPLLLDISDYALLKNLTFADPIG